MDKSFMYDKPVNGIKGSTNTVRYWDEAINNFSKKKYRESICSVLNYLDPAIMAKHGSPDCSEFLIPHGSVLIVLKISNDSYEIKTPFLKLSEKKANVILRQVAEMNFATLLLSQIQLSGDELCFYYKSPLELCEPYKMYDIFYEICVFADYYDDIFIDELGAERLREMQVAHYSKPELESLWEKFGHNIDEAFDYIDYCEKNRWFDSAIYCAMIVLKKIDYSLQPQGVLRSDIEDAINNAHNKNLNTQEILEKLKIVFNKLKEYSIERFTESMYKPHFLISVKTRAELPVVKDILKKDWEFANKDFTQAGYFSACYVLYYAIYNLLYRNIVPRKVEEILNEGLRKSGGRPFKKAAARLLKSVTQVLKLK